MKRLVFFPFVFLLALAPAARAALVTLQSSVLQVEVTEDPYSFRVVERATGDALLVERGVEVTVEGQPRQALAVAGKAALGTGTLDADLRLATAGVAHVAFSFPRPEVLQVQVTGKAGAPQRIKERFADQGEHNYGIWEYPFNGSIDNRGIEGDLLGTRKNPDVWYTSGRAPFYMTSRKYGVYARSSARGHYAVAVGNETSFSFDTPALTYDVIYGPSYYDILARYTAIAGGPFMPPDWAFGTSFWSDDFHLGLHDAKNAQENVMDLANQLAAHRIRATSICMDRPFGTGEMGWGNMDFDPGFPDPAKMVRELGEHGLTTLVWIANRAWNNLYREGLAKGYLFPATPKLGPAVDMRNPAAYAWFRSKLEPYLRLGVKGFKIDRGEQGEIPDAVQNENVTLFDRMAHEALAASVRDDGFIFARNVSDEGRRYTAVWSGDPGMTFAALTRAMVSGLRSGAIVMPMWGSDTGGYVPPPEVPTEELFARWLELSAFSPLMEVLVGGAHTPWYDYSPALVEVTKQQLALHHDLIPYTRSFMRQATVSGAPVMRSLVFSYPDDPHLADVSDELLYGSELLVAPVTTAGVTSRSVYLPKGRWIDYQKTTPAIFQGPRTITAAAPRDSIPVFAREGAIIPRGDVVRGNDTWTPQWSPSLRIQIFPSTSGASRFDYDTGHGLQPIVVTPSKRTVTVEVPDLGAGGTLEIHLRRLGHVAVDGNRLAAGTGYTFDHQVLTVPFHGPAKLVVENAVSLFPASH